MKLLLDTCISLQAKIQLQESGHDVVWGGDWKRDPGEVAILEMARKEDRIVITLDKDFGEIAVRGGMIHAGILRLVSFAAREQGNASAMILSQHGEDLLGGAIVTAEPGRLRIRQSGNPR